MWKREFFSLLYSSSLCTDIARSVRRPASRSSYYYRLLAQYFWLFLADILLRYLRDLHRVVRPDTRLPTDGADVLQSAYNQCELSMFLYK